MMRNASPGNRANLFFSDDRSFTGPSAPNTPPTTLRSSGCMSAPSVPGVSQGPRFACARAAGMTLFLSFAAHVRNAPCGSVRLSPVWAGDEPALVLGPLTVDPAFMDRGIGAALRPSGSGAGRNCARTPRPAGRRRQILRAFRLQNRSQRTARTAGAGRSSPLPRL